MLAMVGFPPVPLAAAVKKPPRLECNKALEKQAKPRQTQPVQTVYFSSVQSLVVSNSQFIAGNIANFLETWKQLTDGVILTIVKGYELEFNQIPSQAKLPNETKVNNVELENINIEISKLLSKGVVVEIAHCS